MRGEGTGRGRFHLLAGGSGWPGGGAECSPKKKRPF